MRNGSVFFMEEDLCGLRCAKAAEDEEEAEVEKEEGGDDNAEEFPCSSPGISSAPVAECRYSSGEGLRIRASLSNCRVLTE